MRRARRTERIALAPEALHNISPARKRWASAPPEAKRRRRVTGNRRDFVPAAEIWDIVPLKRKSPNWRRGALFYADESTRLMTVLSSKK